MKPLSLVILAIAAMHYCSLAIHGSNLLFMTAAIYISAVALINKPSTK